MKLFEYMAAGKPIIASDIGDTAEILENGKAGYILSSPFDLPKTIEKIISNKREALEKAELARKLATEKYDWKILSRKLDAFLLSVCGK